MKGYTNIPDWMLSLDLDIYETIVFAVIFGFSQDGDSVFSGSQNYLAKKAKCSRSKIAMVLPELVKKGLVEKIDKEVRGLKLCEYRVCTTYTGCTQGVQGCIPHTHNNINNNIERDITISNISIKEASFDFKKELVSLGVPASLASEWMKVRKAKKATNTETAFNAVKREINKAGITAEQAIRTAVENSWSGFKASWLSNERNASRVRPHKESVFEHNLKVADQMFGTNYHATIYGKREACDEQ